MKTTYDIVALIETKKKEHIVEIENCDLELPKLQEEMRHAVEKNKASKALTGQKVMILKDKILFHKACAMVLQDLLDTINNG